MRKGVKKKKKERNVSEGKQDSEERKEEGRLLCPISRTSPDVNHLSFFRARLPHSLCFSFTSRPPSLLLRPEPNYARVMYFNQDFGSQLSFLERFKPGR